MISSKAPSLDIMLKYRPIIFQITVTKAIFDVAMPYRSPSHQTSKGTGFLTKIKNPSDGSSIGIILTSAHVIANAIRVCVQNSITGKFPIPVKVVMIDHWRDVGCLYIDPKIIDMIYGENFLNAYPSLESPLIIYDAFPMHGIECPLKMGQMVRVFGYPLGHDEIKYNQGYISGFQTLYQGDNKRHEYIGSRSPLHIQIDSGINPGNSGGPLINEHGQVIGIISSGIPMADGIGYAIPGRTVLKSLTEFIKTFHSRDIISSTPWICSNPNWAVTWAPSRTPCDQNKCMTSGDDDSCEVILPEQIKIFEGIQVINISDFSSLYHMIKTKDILMGIIFQNIHLNPWTHYIDRPYYFVFNSMGELKSGPIDSSMMLKSENSDPPILEYVGLSTIIDLIPDQAIVQLNILRNGKVTQVSGKYNWSYNPLTDYRYLYWQPCLYTILAGMLIIQNYTNLSQWLQESMGITFTGPGLIIVHIFNGSIVDLTGSVSGVDRIDQVQGYPIQSMTQLTKIIQDVNPRRDVFRSSHLSIRTSSGHNLKFTWNQVIDSDRSIINDYQIWKPYYMINNM